MPALSAFSPISLSLPLYLSPSLSLFISLSLSLTDEEGAHTLFTGQRERKREGELSRIVIFIFKRNDGCLDTF
jgi:hypothetical protein